MSYLAKLLQKFTETGSVLTGCYLMEITTINKSALALFNFQKIILFPGAFRPTSFFWLNIFVRYSSDNPSKVLS